MHSQVLESKNGIHQHRRNEMKNPILEKTFIFSLKIIAFTEMLQAQKKFNLANQLFRSGTAIGALVKEAQSPESLADFIHKLKIAAKEGQEAQYWLELCKLADEYPDPDDLLIDLLEINKLLTAIISSSKQKLVQKKHQQS
jgi:four helix bundle protein